MPMSPRLLRPRASGFNPKNIAGLIGWWDAASLSDVTLDAGRVAGLTDKSGNNRNATNTASGSTQPEYIIGGRNGLNVARYVGADGTFLETSNITTPASHTIFFAFTRPTAGTHSVGLGATGGGSYAPWWFSDNVIYVQSSVTGTTHGPASTLTGGFIATIRRTGTSEVLVRRSPSFVSSITTGAGVTTAPTGLWNRIGRIQTVSMSGDFCELFVYNSSLSDVQVSAAEKYLSRKWGISYP
jgi:hypothetical protein